MKKVSILFGIDYFSFDFDTLTQWVLFVTYRIEYIVEITYFKLECLSVYRCSIPKKESSRESRENVGAFCKKHARMKLIII